jgi:hypothetical protein
MRTMRAGGRCLLDGAFMQVRPQVQVGAIAIARVAAFASH